MAGIIILFGFIVAGILTGLNVVVPYSYSQYIAVAILACLDSVFGALSANIERKFKLNIFLSGFVCNALIAIFLVFIGNKLNVDIYLAVVVVFTWRLLNNLTSIRRDFVKKLDDKKGSNNSKKNLTVIVETERGLQFGTVVTDIVKMEKDKIHFPLKKVIRISTKKDYTEHLNNIKGQ